MQAILILDAELHLPVVLRRIIEEARELVDAQYGALGVLTEDGRALDEFLTVGLGVEDEQAIGPRPTGRGVLGRLIADDKPLRLSNIADSADSYGIPTHHPAMTSFLGVPVRVHGEVYGILYLTNKNDAKEFSEDDEELVLALAMAAGIAIENARLHGLVRDRALTEDRDRIARDLHDSVIQRLFAIGLSLQGTARLVERPEAVMRIGEAIDKLDETIRQLRKAIFDIELTINKEGLHPKVLDLVHELRPVLGLLPQVSFSGPVDTVVTGSLVRGFARGASRGAHERWQARPRLPGSDHHRGRGRAAPGRGGRRRRHRGHSVVGARPEEHPSAGGTPGRERRARNLAGGGHPAHLARARHPRRRGLPAAVTSSGGAGRGGRCRQRDSTRLAPRPSIGESASR